MLVSTYCCRCLRTCPLSLDLAKTPSEFGALGRDGLRTGDRRGAGVAAKPESMLAPLRRARLVRAHLAGRVAPASISPEPVGACRSQYTPTPGRPFQQCGE